MARYQSAKLSGPYRRIRERNMRRNRQSFQQIAINSNTSGCNTPMRSLGSKSAEVRIAFLGESLTQWTGGVDFLRLCISGLASATSNGGWDLLLPKATIMQRTASAASSIKRQLFSFVTKRKAPQPAPVSLAELQDAMNYTEGTVEIIRYRSSRAGLIGALSRRKSEVLYPCQLSLGKKFPFPG